MVEQSQDHIVKFETLYRSYNRDYHATIVMNLSELEIGHFSWLAGALRQLSEASNDIPPFRAYIYSIGVALKALWTNPKAKNLCNITREELTTDHVGYIFSSLENTLALLTQLGSESRRKTSFTFRNFFFKYTSEPNCINITKEEVNYKTILGRLKNHSREVLNSKQSNFDQSENEYPLGATPHNTFDELVEKSASKLEADLTRIQTACTDVLDEISYLRVEITKIESTHTITAEKNIVAQFILTKYPSTSDIEKMNNIPPARLLAVFLQLISDLNLFRANAPRWTTYKAKKMFDAAGVILPKNIAIRQVVGIRFRLTFLEVQSILILLLCRTGWNRDSLIEMDINGITPQSDGSLELQGFKNKTDDHTPVIFVDHREKHIIQAVDLLKWNRQQLVSLGYIPTSEKRLWFSWSRGNRAYLQQSVQIQMTPTNFISKHNLFPFSLDQIRTQVLNIEQYRSRSVDNTRRIAGHSNLGTTGKYLDQIYSYNINSSMNLEFQRRLENKIIFNMKKSKKISADHVTLVPIGDGTYCRNPYTPPEIDMVGSVCAARNCHKGEGCSNREIIIDETRMIEVIRKHHYYSHNWQRIYTENEHKFTMHIAPSLLFNNILYDYISNSAYGFILKKLERAIFDDQ